MNTYAALFDWDGVVIDSSVHHEESWNRLAAEEVLPLPEGHFEKSFGMKNGEIIPGILGWTDDPGEIRRLSNRKEVLYREIVEEEGTKPLPGVTAWLAALQAAGIPCVIATSTDRANVELILGLTGLAEFFSGMVTSEDVKNGKPHPEVFLKAAEAAGGEPGHAVVFEDAPVGIRAGKAAGMRVVAVTTTRAREDLREADQVVDRLDELSVPALFP